MPNDEQLAELVSRVTQAEESIKTAKAELRTAERAGVDIQAERTRLDDLANKVKRIKSAYNI